MDEKIERYFCFGCTLGGRKSAYIERKEIASGYFQHECSLQTSNCSILQAFILAEQARTLAEENRLKIEKLEKI